MSDTLIVSVSGIRGLVGQTLTADTALAFASGLGSHLRGGRVLISRDGRPSGSMLRHAVVAGLLEAGCEVHDLGVAPTPTVGIAVKRLDARGAIQITASHNPPEWNGLKLFGGDGRILNAVEGRRVQDRFLQRAFQRVEWRALGSLTECRTAESWHRDAVMRVIDVVRIRAAGLRTLLDANGGAGGPLGSELLRALQTDPVCIGCHADGDFAHTPEPTAENLREIAPLVAERAAAIGFALDPDSDRLALIDEQGRYIGEELTLALAVKYRLGQERGPVVINMSTSRLVEDIAAKYGCVCHRSAVGEANVVDRMLQVNALIGGEGNGGVIDPRIGLVRDPFIGMGLVLNLMAESGKSLSALVAELPAYHIVKDKYIVEPELLPGVFRALESRWPNVRLNREDGLRIDWEDRWIHIRPSNTEPIVRVIAESRREEEALALCREVGMVLRESQ
jgi:phosphomannomutase